MIYRNQVSSIFCIFWIRKRYHWYLFPQPLEMWSVWYFLSPIAYRYSLPCQPTKTMGVVKPYRMTQLQIRNTKDTNAIAIQTPYLSATFVIVNWKSQQQQKLNWIRYFYNIFSILTVFIAIALCGGDCCCGCYRFTLSITFTVIPAIHTCLLPPLSRCGRKNNTKK